MKLNQVEHQYVKSVADVMEKWVSGPSQPQSRADRENKSDFSLIDPDSDKLRN